jgi:hypothetical protein
MCIGNDSGTAASQIQANQTLKAQQDAEDKRQTNIKTGQGAIDQAFSGYDDPYFSKFKQNYIDANTGDVDNQYAVAKDKLTAALADRGVLNSTIAGNGFGQLDKTRNDAFGAIANNAGDAENQFRNSVEKTKSDLYGLNTSAADPNAISARATGEAASLVAPPTTSSLGDIFSGVLSPLVNYTKAAIYSPTSRGGLSLAPTSGAGNGRVVV